MEEVKDFWNTCGANLAHLKFTWEVTGLRKRLLDEHIFKRIDFKNKTVIDYGCGGGYITKYLCDEFGIKKSACIDIAERSIYIAQKILRGYKNVDYHIAPVEFRQFEADIFLTISVIQHFPDEQFLIEFLKNINESGIKTVVLTIRYDKKTKFNGAYMDDNNDKCLACMTNNEYILKYMKNYNLIYFTEPQEKSKYQFLIYEVKNEL